MKTLLHTLTHWKLPPGPWAWQRPNGKTNELHMGVFVVQDPSNNNELVKVKGGIVFQGEINFHNIDEQAPDQFMQTMANLPAFRSAFMEMRGLLLVSAQLLKEAANDSMPVEWHQSMKTITSAAEVLAPKPDEQKPSSLIVTQ